MTATAAGAESVAAARPPAHAASTGSVIEVSSDFAVSGDLEFPGDVVLLPPAPPDTPSILRLSMRPDVARDLLDRMLGLGYHVRRAAAGGLRPATTQQFYVRGSPGGPARLRCTGGLTVARGAEGRSTLAPAGGLRLEEGARWAGDVDAGDDVWLEQGACIHGAVRTPAVLVLDKGSHVEGALQVGRVRFRSGEAPDPMGLPRVPAARPQPSGAGQAADLGADAKDGEAAKAGTAGAGTARPPSVPLAPAPVQRADPLDGLPALPGRFRVVARVAAAAEGDERPQPVRAHQAPGQLLEVEVLAASRGGWVLLLHPGTPAQRRVECSPAEARRDPLLVHLAPILPRVTTLRFVYGDGVRGVRASADSLRWLITLFGKILRLESRLDRLEEMRILTGGEQARSLPPRSAGKTGTRRRRRAKPPAGTRRGPRRAAKARAPRPRGRTGPRARKTKPRSRGATRARSKARPSRR